MNDVNVNEKNIIPHIKRFVELLSGDKEFRDNLEIKSDKCYDIMNEYGIHGIDLDQYYIFRDELNKFSGSIDKIQYIDNKDNDQVVYWKKYFNLFYNNKSADNYHKLIKPNNSKFNKWREIQINRCKGQLSNSNQLQHIIAAFELSDGCTGNCSFCGISSEGFNGYFKYSTKNVSLWHDVLNVVKSVIGDIKYAGVCYYGTEPSDNPDYFNFLDDFGKIFDYCPQSTTVVAGIKDDFIKKLLDFRINNSNETDRFSILSNKQLKKVLKTYSAEELVNVKLIIQYSEDNQCKLVNSGRNRKKGTQCDETISCVSGFLINMVKRSIKLITPCSPSDKYPLGYIVIDEDYFENALDLENFIQKTIDLYMSDNRDDDIIRFRDDLEYSEIDNGFILKAKYRTYKFYGEDYMKELGELIFSGNLKYKELISKLNDMYSNIFKIILTMNKLKSEALIF